MASGAVARRYAAAYFDLARDEDATESRGADLARAVETLQLPEVLDALGNPRIDLGDRVGLALELVDGLGEPTRNLVRLLVERGRIAVLPGVLEQYRVLADRAAGVVRADVTSAVPVTEAQWSAIVDALRRDFGDKVEVDVHHDASIIGGLVIRVGDRVVDTSMRTRLQQLQASLR